MQSIRRAVTLGCPTADTAAARDEKGRAGRLETMMFKHIDDFSHIYVCIYMETLLRLLDLEQLEQSQSQDATVASKRWFLNAVEAARAGLKGR